MISSAKKVLDDVVVDLKESGRGIETKQLAREYSMTAIMAAGFNIGMKLLYILRITPSPKLKPLQSLSSPLAGLLSSDLSIEECVYKTNS